MISSNTTGLDWTGLEEKCLIFSIYNPGLELSVFYPSPPSLLPAILPCYCPAGHPFPLNLMINNKKPARTSVELEQSLPRERESVIIPPPDSPLISQRFSEGRVGSSLPPAGPSASTTRGKLAQPSPLSASTFSDSRYLPDFFIFRYIRAELV